MLLDCRCSMSDELKKELNIKLDDTKAKYPSILCSNNYINRPDEYKKCDDLYKYLNMNEGVKSKYSKDNVTGSISVNPYKVINMNEDETLKTQKDVAYTLKYDSLNNKDYKKLDDLKDDIKTNTIINYPCSTENKHVEGNEIEDVGYLAKCIKCSVKDPPTALDKERKCQDVELLDPDGNICSGYDIVTDVDGNYQHYRCKIKEDEDKFLKNKPTKDIYYPFVRCNSDNSLQTEKVKNLPNCNGFGKDLNINNVNNCFNVGFNTFKDSCYKPPGKDKVSYIVDNDIMGTEIEDVNNTADIKSKLRDKTTCSYTAMYGDTENFYKVGC